jgi:hypothetical protein
MAEVVEADPAQGRLGDQPLDRLAERLRINRLAVLVGDYVLGASVESELHLRYV